MAYNDIQFQLIVSVLLTFLVVNFDFTVSAIFLFFAYLTLFFFLADKFVAYRTERDGGNRTMQVVYAILAYIVFNVVASIALSVAGGIATASGSAFSVFNDSLFQFFSQNTPALTENAFISLIVWGVLIPVVETAFFFGVLFEFFIDKMKVAVGWNARTIAVMLIIGGIFTLFHLTAKGITNNSALLVTFLFAIASLVLVVQFRQTIEAKILHVAANTVALILGTGLAVTNLAVLSVIGLVLTIHFFPLIKLKLGGVLPFA